MELNANLIYLIVVLAVFLPINHFGLLVTIFLCGLLLYSRHFDQNVERDQSFKIESLFGIEKFTASNFDKNIECPKWLKFPGFYYLILDYERVVWLNHSIDTIWNHGFREALERTLTETFSKLVDEAKPKYLNNLSFKSIYLGSNPPIIGGVKVRNKEKSCFECANGNSPKSNHVCEPSCVIDFTFVFSNSDPKIVFNYKSKGLFAINDIQLKAKGRIKICQFVNALPGFGKIEFSFLDKPKFNYTVTAFKILLSSFPILKKWLDKFFTEDIIGELKYPKYVVLETDFDEINFLKTSGKLKINNALIGNNGVLKFFLHKINLSQVTRNSTRVYCLFKLAVQNVQKTSYFESKNPKNEFTFNENHIFYEVENCDSLQLFVINEGENGFDEILGQSSIDIKNFIGKGLKKNLAGTVFSPGTGCNTGNVYFDAQYIPPKDMSNQENASKRQKPPKKKNIFSLRDGVPSIHLVTLKIIGAKEISVPLGTRLPDIRAYVQISDFVLRTKLRPRTSKPYWNEQFQVELPFLATKELTIFIFDAKNRIIGKSKIKFLDEDGLSLFNKNEEEQWHFLKNTKENKSGRIKIAINSQIINLAEKKKIFYSKNLKEPLNAKSQNEFDMRAKANRNQNLLVVNVLRGIHLSKLTTSTDELNTFVSIVLNENETKSTRIIEKCSSPVWQEQFEYSTKKSSFELQFKVFNSISGNVNILLGLIKLKVDFKNQLRWREQWIELAEEGQEQLIDSKIFNNTDLATENDDMKPSNSLPSKSRSNSSFQNEIEMVENDGFANKNSSSTDLNQFSDSPSKAMLLVSLKTSSFGEQKQSKLFFSPKAKNGLRIEKKSYSSKMQRLLSPAKLTKSFLELSKNRKEKKTSTEKNNSSYSNTLKKQRLLGPYSLILKRKFMKKGKRVELKIVDNEIIWTDQTDQEKFSALKIDRELSVRLKTDNDIVFQSGDISKTFSGESAIVKALFKDVNEILNE